MRDETLEMWQEYFGWPKPDTYEWGWIIGIFEGEGCICKSNKTGNIRLLIKMSDEDVVRRLHSLVNVGSVCGPKIPKNNRGTEAIWKPCWEWSCYGRQARRLVAAMAPYLGSRRQARRLELLERFPKWPKMFDA